MAGYAVRVAVERCGQHLRYNQRQQRTSKTSSIEAKTYLIISMWSGRRESLSRNLPLKQSLCIRQSGIPNGPLPFARNQRVIAKRHSRLRPLSSVFGPPWLGVVPRLRDEGGLLLTVAASELSDVMLEAVNAVDRPIRSILIPTF